MFFFHTLARVHLFVSPLLQTNLQDTLLKQSFYFYVAHFVRIAGADF